jgi:hypothetical protein
MVLVFVVALLMWGGIMGLRSYVYYRLATFYSTQERAWRMMAKRDRGSPRSIAAKWGVQTADFYAPLARKYRRAMWRPWLPVAPDPPAPVFR